MLLTRAECVAILKNFLNAQKFELLNYDLVSDKSAIGYLGDYYALILSYRLADAPNEQQQKFFVKALPQQSDETEKEAIFSKEAWLYEQLLANMQKYSRIKWSANCYYTRADLCVLQDITQQGYALATSKLLTLEQLQQVLRSLAAFHAASFVYEQRSGKNIGLTFGHKLQEITVAANIAWFSTGLKAVLDVLRSLPQYHSNKEKNFINQQLPGIVERVYEQVQPARKYRNVLCHRDLWAGNIFFAQQQPALLVDYQTCRYSPPAVDLAFCLYLNLTSQTRAQCELQCLDFYYNWLQADLQHFGLAANELLSKAQLLQSYEEYRLVATVYNALAATMINVPTHYVTNEYKYVNRSDTILKYMQQNKEFADIMQRICGEVYEVAVSMAERSL
ncbi:uncharacterized protein LOC108602226 [Drosophila busckii]|uniref:uncharacterized protein LOC108602226 n=1 Tax=Drosophila busckii TaxID=30019 RepID=UPI00083EF1F8|nr:uncharacterized protein LOC108602226 [Drosophila busckii]